MASLDVAGSAQAYTDHVLSLGFQGKLGVEGGDAVAFRQGHAQSVGDHLLNILRHIAENVHGFLQAGHHSAALALVLLDHFLQLCVFFLVVRHTVLDLLGMFLRLM